MNSNRCPNCGGVADHYVINIEGNSYFKCNTGLTSLGDVLPGEKPKVSHIIRCETVLNNTGHVYTGAIAYDMGSKTRTVMVRNGKIQ